MTRGPKNSDDYPEHSHSRLVSNSQDRVVPTFKHIHAYSDSSHHHFIDKDKDKDLIPKDIRNFWADKWEVE
jgi:hypothetical protein